MINVVSIKFKNRGKCYFFDPNGLDIKTGEKVIVETSKGLEIADCSYGVHAVEDTAVVQPLRPVVRIATKDDMRVADINSRREKEAFDICQKKIAEHGLDMKLVDVECNFEGNKTTFFFTSDGRVDFRELVKDLAGIFRNRIELRQIGVRDEAKMLGGLGICGRPYCCHQFLEDFQPVSTKMAKVQSLSLNPTKISGSCGRLMCCLRYEQDAYEDLLRNVPKQGAYVETTEGYGVAEQINLLRQTVKVKLDKDGDDSLHVFKACEVASVPGGRPKDGEVPPSVLKYVPVEEEEVESSASEWEMPVMLADDHVEEAPAPEEKPRRSDKRKDRRGNKPHDRKFAEKPVEKPVEKPAERPVEAAHEKSEKPEAPEKPAPADARKKPYNRNRHRGNVKLKAVENGEGEKATKPQSVEKPKTEKVKPEKSKAEPAAEAAPNEFKPKKNGYYRRGYHHKPKPKAAPGGENK